MERISEEQKLAFEVAVINKIKEVVDTELAPFAFKNIESHKNVINKNNTIVYFSILSNFFFQHNGLEKYVEDNLFTQIITSFIRSILQNIDYKEISYDNKHKQRTLIDAIKKLSLKPSVAIGNRDDFWGDEEERDILKNILKQ